MEYNVGTLDEAGDLGFGVVLAKTVSEGFWKSCATLEGSED